MHLDAGYHIGKTRNLLDTLGCRGIITTRVGPVCSARWVIERANSWHNRGFKKRAICTQRRTRTIDAFITLAKAIIIVRRLITEAWASHRSNGPATRQP